jgi:hypothetical protein
MKPEPAIAELRRNAVAAACALGAIMAGAAALHFIVGW